MASTTTYKVDIVYDLKGNAQRGLTNMKQQAVAAQQSFGGLRSTLALLGGGALFAGASKFLIGFNRDIDKMKIGLSTVIATNFHKPFASAQVASEKLFNTFQKMAIESPATTKDFVEMANMISGGVLQAGMGLKELESITKGAILASAALGARPDMLALDVQQMLAGTVAIRDRYARQLLAGVGVYDHLAFNKKSGKERAELVQKAFSTPALMDAGKAYEQSFSGVTAQFKDLLEINLGKAGLPLFKAITEEVKSWNKWISNNPQKIADMASSLGTGLKSAFSFVKDMAQAIFPILQGAMSVVGDVLKFAANHKDTLIKVVEAMLVYKGVGMVTGAARGVGGALGGIGGGFKDAINKITEGLKGSNGLFPAIGSVTSGFLGLLGPLAMVGGALYGLFSFLTDKTEDEKAELAKLKAERALAKDVQGGFSQLENMRERLLNIGVNPYDPKQLESLGGLKDTYEGAINDLKALEAKAIEEGIKAGAIKEELGPGGRRLTYTGAGDLGTGELNTAILQIFKSRYNAAFDKWEAAGGIHGLMPMDAAWTKSGIGANFFEDMVMRSAADLYNTGAPTKPPEVKVNINKIEVYSDDPDRFVHQAVSSFEEIVRNPTSAREIMRGAF